MIVTDASIAECAIDNTYSVAVARIRIAGSVEMTTLAELTVKAALTLTNVLDAVDGITGGAILTCVRRTDRHCLFLDAFLT